MYWRTDFSEVSRETLTRRLTGAGELHASGVRVPVGAREVSLTARGIGRDVELRLTVGDERGRLRTLPLRRRGAGTVSARLPSPRLRVLGLQLTLPALEQFFLAHRETEGGVSATPTATLVFGPLRARSQHRSWLLTDWRGWRLPSGDSVVRSGGGVRLNVVFQETGASLAFRPTEPTDGRVMPVVTSPDVAAAAGGVGSRTVLDFEDVQIPVSVVGVAKRMPTVPSGSGPFVLAEQSWLSTAINAGAPGRGTAAEVWISAGDEHAAESSLRRPPFAALSVTSRSSIEHRLATDPLAHATALALGAAAIVALLLAVLGFWVSIVSELRDERSDFFDLEAQGLAPAGLRAQLRARAVALLALGLTGGVCLGLLLSGLVVSLVRISATTASPDPPLRFDPAWIAMGLLTAALVVLAVGVAEGTSAAAFRDARPRRTSWSLE
jgi:hypothetical protein